MQSVHTCPWTLVAQVSGPSLGPGLAGLGTTTLFVHTAAARFRAHLIRRPGRDVRSWTPLTLHLRAP
eukprot:5180082-Alexandrium_andersonii.AAC.1